MTSYEASKMAKPGTDPPEVAREDTKGEDVTKDEYDPESDNPCSISRRRFMEPPDKLPMTTTACDKINIFAEGEVTFKSLIFDPDSQPPEQFNKHGQAAEIIKLYIRRVLVTDDFTDMMTSYHNFVVLLNPMILLSMSPDPRGAREDNSRPPQKGKILMTDMMKEYTMTTTRSSPCLTMRSPAL
jgi:hypothetical protein